MSKKALGKGLSSIFLDLGTALTDENANEIVKEISIDDISPNPFQPRKIFQDEELKDLATSIKQNGLLQPILLRKHDKAYQIIAGERRWRASKSIGLKTIPAQVRENVSDRDMMELSIIENIQRVELSPIEEAKAYDQLMQSCGLTHEDLSLKLAKQRSTVTNILRLLKLDLEVQKLLDEGKLTSGHARALLKYPQDKQLFYANKIINEKMSVRGAETIKKAKQISFLDSNLQSFIQKMQYALGTKITVKGTEKKGRLEIHYNSKEELEKISEIIRNG